MSGSALAVLDAFCSCALLPSSMLVYLGISKGALTRQEAVPDAASALSVRRRSAELTCTH